MAGEIFECCALKNLSRNLLTDHWLQDCRITPAASGNRPGYDGTPPFTIFMRPNFSVILVILALVVSVLVGIISGGGWQVWLAEPVIDDGVNENVTLPIAPA